MVTLSTSLTIEKLHNTTWDYSLGEFIGQYRKMNIFKCSFRIDGGIGFDYKNVISCNLNEGWILLNQKRNNEMEFLSEEEKMIKVKFSGVLTIGDDKRKVVIKLDKFKRQV